MKSRFVIFVAVSFWVVASIYSFSSLSLFQASAASAIRCDRTGTVKVTCCQDRLVNVGTPPGNPGTTVTYCTDCEMPLGESVGIAGYINCSERYIQMSAEEPPIPVPPGAVARLQEGGVLGEATTLPEVSVLEAQRANITILPGGILQTENSSNNTMPSEQSDLVSGAVENTTSTVDEAEEEQEESGPSKEQAREGADEADDKENIDEELPLE